MADPHRNIFFYYRGQTRAETGKAERLRDQQIEDNATKALINVLEWGVDELTTSFVSRFIPKASSTKGSAPYEYFLQGGPATEAPQRWLLAISQADALPTASEAEVDGGSRIDGGLRQQGELLVVFEVKLGLDVDAGQLSRHRKKLKVPAENTIAVTWASIYEWAEEGKEAGDLDAVTTFLLSQFLEFLRHSSLSPFGGLHESDFAYFDDPSWDRQPEIKAQLAALWEKVLEQLDPLSRASLGEVHVGQLGPSADHAWAQTHQGEKKVNFTLELSSQTLELNVVAWLENPAQRMLTWLRSEKASALADFHGFWLFLYQRRAKNFASRSEGKPAWWQREDHHVVEHVEAACGRERIAAMLGQIDEWDSRWEKPAFHLRRFWTREEVVSAKFAIAKLVASEVQRMLPVLHELNGDRAPH